MDYREQRAEACKLLFAGFHPECSNSHNPELILKIRDMAAAGMFSAEIAEALGTTAKAVQKAYRRYNFPVLKNFCERKREQRNDWKGGVKIVKGYSYSRTPGHPLASKYGNYVAVHRLVMEQTLGRLLLKTEVVDHIDGNTQNNSPENLRVFQSNAEHLRVTLVGKCPNWSEDGKRRIAAGRKLSRQMQQDQSTQPSHEQ
jgi:HNH endonuclease